MHKTKITYVYSYYNNPEMFKIQQNAWLSYDKKYAEQLEIIVTDDCSSKWKAEDNLLPDIRSMNFRLFHIDEKVKWNWLEARNIGCYYADGKWILMTDMDHLVKRDVLSKLFKKLPGLDDTKVYQFERMKYDGLFYKHHNDSFFLTKELFWLCGGYDEDYAGYYGTSGKFRRRLYRTARAEATRFKDLSLILYGREVIPDASTTEFNRKEGRKKGELEKVRIWKKNNNRSIIHFKQPYHEVL